MSNRIPAASLSPGSEEITLALRQAQKDAKAAVNEIRSAAAEVTAANAEQLRAMQAANADARRLIAEARKTIEDLKGAVIRAADKKVDGMFHELGDMIQILAATAFKDAVSKGSEAVQDAAIDAALADDLFFRFLKERGLYGSPKARSRKRRG